MRAFKNPASALGKLDADDVSAVVMAAADIALVLDDEGVINDVSISNTDLGQALDQCRGWTGRPWRDVVTIESRPKLDALLADAAESATPRWRHLNHASAHGPDVPVAYSAIRTGPQSHTLALGRDMRNLASLQQRLVDAQQSLDTDYNRLQQFELRYRLLFQFAPDPVVIVDTAARRIMEANTAASTLFGVDAKRLAGRPLVEFFASDHAGAVHDMLNTIRVSGRAEAPRLRLAHPEGAEAHLFAMPFRQDNQQLCMIRFASADPDAHVQQTEARLDLQQIMEHAPDGFVVTDRDGGIIYANAAFLDLAQLSQTDQAIGQHLENWLGQPGLDVGVLTANLKQRGSVRLYATTMRGEHGVRSDVEVSASAVTSGGEPVYGFIIRNVARRRPPEPAARAVPRTPEQLTELIGRVPLKDLVRETTDVIERLCIVAALELTGNNRASAAEMLGLSRQSLYVKLRRFGIDAEGEDDGDV